MKNTIYCGYKRYHGLKCVNFKNLTAIVMNIHSNLLRKSYFCSTMKIHFFDVIKQEIYRGRMYHEATTVGVAKQLQQGEPSDYSKGSGATTARGAE
jgi:hypothetical protein